MTLIRHSAPVPWTLLLWAGLLGAAPLSAQEAPPKLLKLTVAAGFVHAAGNTQLTTLSGDERLEYRTRDSLWLFNQFAEAVYGHTNDSTTASQMKAGARAGRMVTHRLSVFAGGTAERNRFAGITRRFEEVFGVGFQALQAPKDQLSLEAGAAFTQQRSVAGVDDDFLAARGALAYKHRLSSAAYFQELAEFLPNMSNGDDLRINSETALVAPISRQIAIKLSYTVRFDNLPEPGFKKTDRVFTSALQIAF